MIEELEIITNNLLRGENVIGEAYIFYSRTGKVPEVDPKYFQPRGDTKLYAACFELYRERKREMRRQKKSKSIVMQIKRRANTL